MNTSLHHNIQIKRGVYGLIGLLTLIFMLVIVLLQLQKDENNAMDELANNYHRLISEKSLLLLRSIDKTRIWFKSHEIEGYSTLSKDEKKPSSFIEYLDFSERDKLNSFKHESQKIIREISITQAKFANPEFIRINTNLEQVHNKVLRELDELLLKNSFSSQQLDSILKPLISNTHQLQRLHQLAIQKIRLKIADDQKKNQIVIITLIIMLTIIGVFGVIRMLHHVRYTLRSLTKSQNDLQSERDFADSLLNTAPVIVLLLDQQGNIQYVNPYFERLSGYQLEQIKGKKWFSFFIPKVDQNHIQETFQRAIRGESIQGNVNIIVTLYGEEHEVEWYSQPMYDKEGMVTGLLSIGQDITERMRTEVELESHREHLEELVKVRTDKMKVALDEAERANAAKSKFLSSMSHELRTPMNAVLGFSNLLATDTESPLNKEQLESVSYIMESGEYLLSLINDILDLSDIEVGNIDINMGEIDVNTLISQLYLLIQPQAKQHSISLVNKVTDENCFKLQADYKKLMQILLNFSTNAVKYNNENGTLTFSAEKTKKNKIRISVSDTGNGVSEELFPILFEPFNRLDNENSNVKGIGIGLTICKQLVELMEGEIGVFQNPDKGLTFWVEFEEAKRHEGMIALG